MNNILFSRALGATSQRTVARAQNDHLLRSLHHASNARFTYRDTDEGERPDRREDDLKLNETAHPAGVNALTIDKFEGRYLLSGGADSSISVWDLDNHEIEASGTTLHRPLGKVDRESSSHGSGITHLSFYPFDSLAFLSSSYDHALRLYSSETLTVSAAFNLSTVVYTHAMSPVADHLLVACATQHPVVRLVDLKSGASAHSLGGHSGCVMTVAWHPSDPNILASGATDGAIRLWDIRRSASSLCTLDMDDHSGTPGLLSSASSSKRNQRGRAHAATCNGIVWTDNGDFLLSAGQDEALRVWSMSNGANTLVNFGPSIKNTHGTTLLPLIAPATFTSSSANQVLIYPNPRELLVMELHTGKTLSKLRTPSYTASHTSVAAGRGTRNVLNRTMGLAWRAHSVEVYSAHTDGTIRAWRPRTWEDRLADEEAEDDSNNGDSQDEADEGGDDVVHNRAETERKRKRDELDDMVRGLTGKKVTYT